MDRIARSRSPTTRGASTLSPCSFFTVRDTLTDAISVRACSNVISGVLPSITCSLTPLTDAAGLIGTTCRSTSPSKNPRSAAKCWFRLAGDPPRPTSYLPTIPGVTPISSTPCPSHQARIRRTACR